MSPAVRKQGEKLGRIANALGSIRALAQECGVSTWTARAWLNGTRTPAPESQRRLNVIANEYGLPPPYTQWETGVQRREPLARLERMTDRSNTPSATTSFTPSTLRHATSRTCNGDSRDASC